MKSAGRGKGWKCPKCGYRSANLRREITLGKREPMLAGLHVPRDEAIKHLIKPRQRYGREKVCVPSPPMTRWADFTPQHHLEPTIFPHKTPTALTEQFDED